MKMKFSRRRKQPAQESPVGLAFDAEKGEIVIAEFAAGGGFDIYRLPAGERRAVNITSSDVRAAVGGWNAHTSKSPLPVTARSSDEEILRSILEAAREDPHASAFNYAFSRNPDDTLSLTQAEQDDISETLARVHAWLDMQRATHVRQEERPHVRLETRTRAVARIWLAGAELDTEAATVAFLTVGAGGYAIGLWGARSGYTYETEEKFESGASAEIAAEQARDVLTRIIAPSSLSKLGLESVTTVVVSAVPALEEVLFRSLREAPELERVPVEGVRLNSADGRAPEGEELDQATALALGALVDDVVITPVDLSITPDEHLERLAQAQRAVERAHEERQARSARLAMAAPAVAVIAFLAATWFFYSSEGRGVQARIEEETQLAAQLKQANADYESSKKNFGMFKSLLDHLIRLRQRQPATHQLLKDLNDRWPRESTWYVSEVSVKGNNVEIKGRTKNEQAVTAFAKSLEFSDGVFTNILTNNNVAGTSLAGASSSAAAPASSVIEFTVRAVYSPMKGPAQAAAPASALPGNPQRPPAAPPVALPSPPAAAAKVPQSTGR